MKIVTLKLEDDADIVRLRSVGKTVVSGAGFDGFAATRIVTAALELGRNAIEHAAGGRLSLFLQPREGAVELVLEAVDQGQGIDSPDSVMAGTRPVTGPGLGLGLRGVRNMADRFDLATDAGGTRVTAGFRTTLAEPDVPARARAIADDLADVRTGDPVQMLTQQNRELLEALAQRDMLMAEVHHRTKNSLSLVMGLMRLSRGGATADETRLVLKELEGRVSAIARVHDRLQSTGAAQEVELTGLLSEVARGSRDAFASSDLRIDVAVRGERLHVVSNAAVDLALVVGELITNACKHAFAGRGQGCIDIACDHGDGYLTVTVTDDGVGLPDGVDRPERSTSLGWQMVRSMVEKHGGTLRTESAAGLVVNMRFNMQLMH